MSGDEDPTYELLLPFDTDAFEFMRGFECGKVWQGLKNGEREHTIHHENAEMVLRMAAALGFAVQSDPLDESFMVVKFS